MSTAETAYTHKLIALVSLWGVSTCVGITYKLSQTNGRYHYSPASAVVMTEAFKLVSSLVIVMLVVARERKAGETMSFFSSVHAFFAASITGPLILHSLGLAFAYAIVNNVTFAIFVHAPASTFFLLKAASPVVTALMLKLLVERMISSVQWISIVSQCVGLVLTQYNGCTHTTELSLLAYVLILVNVAVSCAAGVWNEHIIKTYNVSVNVQNVMLYSSGIILNLVLYFILPAAWFGASHSVDFFDGYTWAVVGVIAANGMVGLVITAVYKYADVVVKTFGLAASTTSMMVLEFAGVLPGTTASRNSLTGAVLVFYASYVYIAPVPFPPVEAPVSLEQGAPQPKPFFDPVARQRVTTMVVIGTSAALFAFLSPPTCPAR